MRARLLATPAILLALAFVSHGLIAAPEKGRRLAVIDAKMQISL